VVTERAHAAELLVPSEDYETPSVKTPGISYTISDCERGLPQTANAEQIEETRFTVTVDGRYIHFEDMMVANCCTPISNLWLEMTIDYNIITVYEREELPRHPCTCICDYPVDANAGPFVSGTYTLEVYEDYGGFIGSTTVTFNHIPVAVTGQNEVEYAWIDGLAEVTLDGSGSYDEDDEDGDELTYLWRWSLDGNEYDTNGVNPTIELPVGQHEIELVVNDGFADSEPNYAVITVIEPIEGTLWIWPQTIHRRLPQRNITALLHLPQGITKDQIDGNTKLLLYPGEIEAVQQYIWPYCAKGVRHVSILAIFDTDELLDTVEQPGQVQLDVVGRLKTGQYFFGRDTTRIINRHHWSWPGGIGK
jgi:hypothetical protein